MRGRHRDRDDRELDAWLEARLHPIDLAADHADAWGELDGLAERTRVASLVESHHFVAEKYAFRRSAVAWLARRGWTWFGEELGWTDGRRIDEHLRTADEGALDRVPTYGHRGCRRPDREDVPWGILASAGPPEPAPAFVEAQRRFARDVRRVAPQARWFGFDVDGWTTAGLEELRELSATDAAVASVVERLDQVPGESLEAEAARVAAVVASAPRLSAAATRALDALSATLRYAVEAYPAPTWEDLRPAMATRERLMWRHVDAVLDDPELAGPDAKVALQAGSLHLLKDDGAIHDETPGIGPGGGLVPSIGHHVAHRRDVGPDRVLAVWMLCGHGRDANPLVPAQGGIAPVEGTLNAALDRLCGGQSVLVPLAGLDREVRIQHMHSAVFRTPVPGQIDAVVYVPEVTPLA